jgi:hypothetical protein
MTILAFDAEYNSSDSDLYAAVCIDVASDACEEFLFHPETDRHGLLEQLVRTLDECEMIVCHNGHSADMPLLEKVLVAYGYRAEDALKKKVSWLSKLMDPCYHTRYTAEPKGIANGENDLLIANGFLPKISSGDMVVHYWNVENNYQHVLNYCKDDVEKLKKLWNKRHLRYLTEDGYCTFDVWKSRYSLPKKYLPKKTKKKTSLAYNTFKMMDSSAPLLPTTSVAC